MPWNHETVAKIATNIPSLPDAKLRMLAFMMLDEIRDGHAAIEEFTRAFGRLRDATARDDNYRAVPALFRRAVGRASRYPDAEWMLDSKSRGKMHPNRLLPPEVMKKLSEELSEMLGDE